MNWQDLAAVVVLISALFGSVRWWLKQGEEVRLFAGCAVAAAGLAGLLTLFVRREAFAAAADTIGPFVRTGTVRTALGALDRAEGDYRLVASCAAFAVALGVVGIFCHRL